MGPLQILKKGLVILERQIKEKRDKLTSQLSPLSPEEEEWLDNGGNTIEEVYAIDALENASDYNRAYDKLGDKYKAAVFRLQEVAGDVIKVAGKKRASKWFIHSVFVFLSDNIKGQR
jgi:hypothetical protein